MSNRNLSYMPIREGDTVIFYLNTGGFPLASDAWNHMWTFAKELQPAAGPRIDYMFQNRLAQPDVPIPMPPYPFLHNRQISNQEKLVRIQHYMDKLQYNHTGFQFFEIKKDRPLIGLAEVARRIIDDSLPIKCLEAIVLGIYLINEIAYPNTGGQVNTVEKFTIGFKSVSKGNVHRHVVLGVFCPETGLFGALGMSRRSSLAFKPLKYTSLAELLVDYINSYQSYMHKVKRIKIGSPLGYSNRSFESINWNGCTVMPCKENPGEWQRAVEKHARTIRQAYLTRENAVSFLSLRNLTNLDEKLRSRKTKSNTYLNLSVNDLSASKKKKKNSLDDEEMSVTRTCTLSSGGRGETVLAIAQKTPTSGQSDFCLPRTASSFVNKRGDCKKEVNDFNSLIKRKKVSLRV